MKIQLGFWTSAAIIIALAFPSMVTAQADDVASRETLRGVTPIAVVPRVSEPCEERSYYGAVIKNESELQLRLAGIKVVPDNKASVTLWVGLFCYEITGDVRGYSYSQWSEVKQWIQWPQPGRRRWAQVTTWKSFIALGIGSGDGRNEQHIKDSINDSVKQFVNAWLSVNQ